MIYGMCRSLGGSVEKEEVSFIFLVFFFFVR
jgi:hypothetical protein